MIPNQLHYVHLSANGREWKLHHHLSVLSAIKKGKFDSVTIWVDTEPTSDWWNATKTHVNIEFVQPPTEIFGKPITQPAHKSDVLRLQILIENGGVYADTDTIFVKPFDTLLDNKCVLGQQNVNGSEGLCPAIILAEKDSLFLKYWLAGFKDSFGGGPPGSDTWCTHSVAYPLWLSHHLPNEITILDHEAFFWPLYHQPHMKMLFEEMHTFPNAYSHHLWESSGKQYLDNIDINVQTTFTNLIKDLL